MAASKLWQKQLKRGREGGILPSPRNVFLVLTHDPKWQGVLAYDSFGGREVCKKPPPWTPEIVAPAAAVAADWSDADTQRLIVWFGCVYSMDVSAATVSAAVTVVAQRNSFHPARDWLLSLKWDKKPRLDSWLVDIAKAEDSPYTRAVGRKFLISAAARVLQPGCKVDTMLVLEGNQGVGKSSMLRALFSDPWFAETSVEIGTKDSYQLLRGKVCVLFDELDSIGRSDLSRVKSFITSPVDTFRSSYGRISEDHPRGCVFAGTVDKPDYLKDEAGNRRFWPVSVGVSGDIDVAAAAAARDQLFAEAVIRYQASETWHLDDAALRKEAAQEAEKRRQVDPWETKIAAWLKHGYEKYAKNGITTLEILDSCMLIDASKMGVSDAMRAARVLRTLGWTDRTQVRVGTSRFWIYKPGKDAAAASNDLPEAPEASDKRKSLN